jgi:hypothetical protein
MPFTNIIERAKQKLGLRLVEEAFWQGRVALLSWQRRIAVLLKLRPQVTQAEGSCRWRSNETALGLRAKARMLGLPAQFAWIRCSKLGTPHASVAVK